MEKAFRSYAPGKYPIETERNILVTEPGADKAQRAAAFDLYRGVGLRFLYAMFGMLPYCAFFILDLFLNNGDLGWMVWPLVIVALAGIGGSQVLANRRFAAARGVLGEKDFAAVKVTLTKRQLGDLILMEEDWVNDSPRHEAVWAWAQSVGRERVQAPDNVFVSDFASA